MLSLPVPKVSTSSHTTPHILQLCISAELLFLSRSCVLLLTPHIRAPLPHQTGMKVAVDNGIITVTAVPFQDPATTFTACGTAAAGQYKVDGINVPALIAKGNKEGYGKQAGSNRRDPKWNRGLAMWQAHDVTELEYLAERHYWDKASYMKELEELRREGSWAGRRLLETARRGDEDKEVLGQCVVKEVDPDEMAGTADKKTHQYCRIKDGGCDRTGTGRKAAHNQDVRL